MDGRLESCTFGQGSNPLNNKFSILCTVLNSSRFINSTDSCTVIDISGNIGKNPIYRRNFAEQTDKKSKFPMTDYRREISCRHSPIHEISADISDFSITACIYFSRLKITDILKSLFYFYLSVIIFFQFYPYSTKLNR